MYFNRILSQIPINAILADGYCFEFQRRGNNFVFRYGDEILWDFNSNTSASEMHYFTNHNKLHNLLRTYYDCPVDSLFEITRDCKGLRDLLWAADKRIGRHRRVILVFKTNSPVARRIIGMRNERKSREA